MRARYAQMGATLLATLALAGCHTEVENALARETGEAGPGLYLSVHTVVCGAPSAARLACTVAFQDSLELPQVTVQLPPSNERFPAAFLLATHKSRILGRTLHSVRVDTPFDGVALPLDQASERLTATARAAQDAAIAKLGPVYHARVTAMTNLHSYTQD